MSEKSTGLNVHWMELNNYTALHLAAASGNAAIIDKVRCRRCGAPARAAAVTPVVPAPFWAARIARRWRPGADLSACAAV